MYYLIIREVCGSDHIYYGQILMSSFDLDHCLTEYLSKYVILNINKHPTFNEYNYWLLEMTKEYHDTVLDNYRNQLLYINKFMKSGCMKLYLNEKSIMSRCKYEYFLHKLKNRIFIENLLNGLHTIYNIPKNEIGQSAKLQKTRFLRRYRNDDIRKKKQNLCLLLVKCIETNYHFNFTKSNGQKIKIYDNNS